jgi:hypothetical protein
MSKKNLFSRLAFKQSQVNASTTGLFQRSLLTRRPLTLRISGKF